MHWVIYAVLTGLLAGVIILVLYEPIPHIDLLAAQLFTSIKSDGLTWLMRVITEAGSVWWLVTLTIAVSTYFFWKKQWFKGLLFLLAMGGNSLLNQFLKMVFSRERPAILPEYDGHGYSFPSAHAMAAATAYGLLAYLISESSLSKGWKWCSYILLSILILLIAVSRVYLGVHYFTDITAGFILGILWLLIIYHFCLKFVTKLFESS